MGRAFWIAGLALFTALVASTRATAETNGRLTLTVVIVDAVGVRAETLRRARVEASRIFDALQIGVVWADGGVPPGRYLVIKIVSKPVSQKSKDPNMLGVTAGSQEAQPATHAWLFYNRIENQRRTLGVDAWLLLGLVMAHEMGHLLLPYGSHTAAGLMKGSWDSNQARLATMGSLTFDAGQAAVIRARLASAGR